MSMYADDTTLYCNVDQHVSENLFYLSIQLLYSALFTNKYVLMRYT